MNTAHTPGPWVVSNVGWVASTTTQQTICSMYAVNSGLDHSVEAANARLIAAAPELLQACQAFVIYDNDDAEDGIAMMLNYEKARTAICAAIAKATGVAA